jgi:hypothetical protein
MSTEQDHEQEAPGVRTFETQDEDAQGHVRINKSDDSDTGGQQPGVRTFESADEDDTEGHVKTGGH